MPIEVINLSRKNQEHQRLVYRTLLRNWWPHPIHGEMSMCFTPEALVFRCACGCQLSVPHAAAEALGFI